MKNRVRILFLTIVIIFTQFTIVFSENGNLSDNISWNFNEGVLEISGWGRMQDLKNAEENPLKEVAPKVKKIIIDEGISYIGSWSFADFKAVDEIVFPSTLESIGERAFYNCQSLEVIKFPQNLNEIGNGAFNSCTSVVRVILPESLEKIGDSAFMNLPKMTAVKIPKNVKSIGKWAFFGCTSLAGIYIDGPVVDKVGNFALTDISRDYTVYLNHENADEWIEEEVFEENRLLLYNNKHFIPVYVNNAQVNFDSAPIIVEGRTLVPVRAIFEAMGVEVSWDDETRIVTAVKEDITVTIAIDDNKMYKNGEVITIDVPAAIYNSRTYVPARAVSEAFDAKVSWDDLERTVYINFDK